MTDTPNKDRAAYPVPFSEMTHRNPNGQPHQKGFTKREEYAKSALQGMLAHPTRYQIPDRFIPSTWHDAIAREAFELADAMIKAGEE